MRPLSPFVLVYVDLAVSVGRLVARRVHGRLEVIAKYMVRLFKAVPRFPHFDHPASEVGFPHISDVRWGVIREANIELFSCPGALEESSCYVECEDLHVFVGRSER